MSRFGKTHDRLAKAHSQIFMKDVHPEAQEKNRRRANKTKRYRTGFERANHIPLEQPISNFSDGSRILF